MHVSAMWCDAGSSGAYGNIAALEIFIFFSEFFFTMPLLGRSTLSLRYNFFACYINFLSLMRLLWLAPMRFMPKTEISFYARSSNFAIVHGCENGRTIRCNFPLPFLNVGQNTATAKLKCGWVVTKAKQYRWMTVELPKRMSCHKQTLYYYYT